MNTVIILVTQASIGDVTHACPHAHTTYYHTIRAHLDTLPHPSKQLASSPHHDLTTSPQFFTPSLPSYHLPLISLSNLFTMSSSKRRTQYLASKRRDPRAILTYNKMLISRHIAVSLTTSITQQNTHSSPFLRLPPELRDKIYKTVFTSQDLIIVAPKTSLLTESTPLSGSVAFLLFCCQVHFEALALLYRYTTFKFDAAHDAQDIQDTLGCLPSPGVSKIVNLCLTFGQMRWLPISRRHGVPEEGSKMVSLRCVDVLSMKA